MRVNILLICAIAFGCAFAGNSVLADSIAVQNPSFETTNPLTYSCGGGCAYNLGPIPGWSGGGGSWQPSSTYLNLPLPDGSTVAFSNGGAISQDLGVSLQPDTTYTLSVYVGNRLDPGFQGDYSIALDAGSTVLNTLSGYNGDITPGTFADEILTFSTGSTVTPGDLTIVLGTNGGQMDFDDVQLTAVDPPPTATPESSSLLMLGTAIGFLAMFAVYSKGRQFSPNSLS